MKAYLLDADVAPKRVLIGLDAIERNFSLSVGFNGDRLLAHSGESIGVRYDDSYCHPDAPHLPIPRLKAGVLFESVTGIPGAETFFDGALIDTGSPYVVIPHSFHKSGLIRIYDNFGRELFRVPSMGEPIRQWFVEVGIRFLGD